MRPRIEVPDDMTRAVVRALENGEIRPWYQPQVSTDTGAVTGFDGDVIEQRSCGAVGHGGSEVDVGVWREVGEEVIA